MHKELEKLLYRRFLLHSQKFHLLQELDLKNYVRCAGTLHRIRSLLAKEITVNVELIRFLQKENFSQHMYIDFFDPICTQLQEINMVLAQERVILSRIHLFSYSYATLEKMLTGKSHSFYTQLRHFQKLTDKEFTLHQIFFELSRKLPKAYQVPEKEVRGSWKLVAQLQEELKKIAYALGDTTLVKKHGESALALISQIQKTEIYEFVQQDVLFIQEKVRYIMAHPKENKMAYFLTTVYIIAPGTFEMTGVILFFRYLGKYTLKKVKTQTITKV